MNRSNTDTTVHAEDATSAVRPTRPASDRGAIAAHPAPGDPMPDSTLRDAIARFNAKVRESASGCWVWTASTRNRDEGQFYWPPVGRPINAARVAWLLHRGPIPERATIRRSCSTPRCVRPEHHELRTVGDRGAAPEGAVIGLWTIVGPDVRIRGKATLWRCRCACGTERWIDRAELKRGRSQSCSTRCIRTTRAPKPPNAMLWARKAGKVAWVCKCACGTEFVMGARSVKRTENARCERCRYASRRRSLAERLWQRVDRGRPTECWPWRGAKTGPKRAYGHIAIGGRYGGTMPAHRAAWIVTHGPIQDRMYVLHRCDNPPCCNPAHLFLGSHVENMQDMRAKGRSAVGDRNGTRTRPDRTARGERIASAKLNRVAVLAIRGMLASGGLSQSRIARSYGVAQSTIWGIATGRTWGWLTAHDNEGAPQNDRVPS